MNQLLPLLLIGGAAWFFWPQIQSLLSPTPATPSQQLPPSILPQPGQYGIPNIVSPPTGSPVSTLPVSTPVVQSLPLAQAYQLLASNVQPPAIDNPPYGVVHLLSARAWNSYLEYYAGYSPSLDRFPNPDTLLTLDDYWQIARPLLQSQGLSGVSRWAV